MTTLLQQAIELAQNGNRDEAESLIRQSLTENPNNEIAWIWLSGVTRDVLVKREALSRVLELNPDNNLAKQGLERFGAPDEEEEVEAPETPIESAQVNINIGTPIVNEGLDINIDEIPITNEPDESETQEASVFTDLPDDFDFNFDMDESPVFDVDLDSLEKPIDTPIENVIEENLFDTDETPAFIDDGESTTTNSDTIADKLEEMFAHSEPGIPVDSIYRAEEEEEEETPVILTEPEPADLVTDIGNEEEDDIHNILKKRQKKQNRLLITASVFFAVLVIGSCSLYYYFTEKVDYYLLMPQLAGSELTVKARGMDNGVSTLDFNGFPASSATINWTKDTESPTCSGGVGLSVDFGNGDSSSQYSNSVCNGDQCSFEKNISPGPISLVKVNYQCGKDAVITLHK